MQLEFSAKLTGQTLGRSGYTLLCWDGVQYFFKKLEKKEGAKYRVTISDERFKGSRCFRFRRYYMTVRLCGSSLYSGIMFHCFSKFYLHKFVEQETAKKLYIKIEIDKN